MSVSTCVTLFHSNWTLANCQLIYAPRSLRKWISRKEQSSTAQEGKRNHTPSAVKASDVKESTSGDARHRQQQTFALQMQTELREYLPQQASPRGSRTRSASPPPSLPVALPVSSGTRKAHVTSSPKQAASSKKQLLVGWFSNWLSNFFFINDVVTL